MIPCSAGGAFVAFVPCHESGVEAEDLFQRASRVIQEMNRRGPDSTLSNGWSFTASYPRLNGSGASIVTDAATGSWLAALGTFFHRCGNNRPEYLLEQYLASGPEGLVNDLDGFFVMIAGNAASRDRKSTRLNSSH